MNKIGSSSAYYIAIKLASQLSVCAIVWQSYDNCVPKNVTQQIKFQHERSSTTYKKILAQIWRTLKRKISATCCFTTRYADFGGERGIRTPGTLQYAGFQDRCIRPLCHLSNSLDCIAAALSIVTFRFTFAGAKVVINVGFAKLFIKKFHKKVKKSGSSLYI